MVRGAGPAPGSAEIRPQRLAPRRMPEPADCFLLDLADAFARQLEFFSDFLEGERVLAPQAEIEPDDLGFALGEGAPGPFHCLAQRFLDEDVVGYRRALILDDVEEAVILSLLERRVHGEV